MPAQAPSSGLVPGSSPAPSSETSSAAALAGISKRNGHPISFWEFTRYGSVVALVTLAIATPYLLLRY